MSIIRELVGKPDIRDLKLLSIQVGKTAGVSGKVHDETVGIEKLLLIAAVLLIGLISSILPVSEERTADAGKVGTNLMGSAGKEFYFQQAQRAIGLKHTIFRTDSLGVPHRFLRDPDHILLLILLEETLQDTLLRFGTAENHAKIILVELPVLHLLEEQKELMPLPSANYHFMERKTAKVSSDFHVRFDNAYYSVDKAYLHKDVLIKATTTTVRIYSRGGEFICEHERARYKGQHVTDVRHLPKHFSSYRSWNGPYFIGQAMEVGQNTVKVIKQVLASRKLEVQTYRLCVGLLGYKDRYSKEVLEECCRRALELNRPYYSFIKNTIGAVADELGVHPDTVSPKEAEPERGGIPRPGRASDLDTLLNRS